MSHHAQMKRAGEKKKRSSPQKIKKDRKRVKQAIFLCGERSCMGVSPCLALQAVVYSCDTKKCGIITWRDRGGVQTDRLFSDNGQDVIRKRTLLCTSISVRTLLTIMHSLALAIITKRIIPPLTILKRTPKAVFNP